MNDETALIERLHLFEIDDDCRVSLRAVWQIIEARLDGILDGFVGKLATLPAAAVHLAEAEAVAQLKTTQTLHWQSLFSGTFDPIYAQRVGQLGLTDAAATDPRWIVGGYGWLLNAFAHHVRLAHRWDHARADRLVAATSRAMMLDLDLTLEYGPHAAAVVTAPPKRDAAAFERGLHGTVESVVDAALHMEVAAQAMSALADSALAEADAAAQAADCASADARDAMTESGRLDEVASAIRHQIALSADISAAAAAEGRVGAETMVNLAQSGHLIASATHLITAIAQKTNILAINAAIEAARVGEVGKGFGVVASEVKGLSRRSADATDQISTFAAMIQTSAAEAGQAVASMGQTVARIDDVAAAIAEAVDDQGTATQAITAGVSRVAADTQAVNAAIAKLQGAARDSREAARTVHAAAACLSAQAGRLARQVAGFTTDMRG